MIKTPCETIFWEFLPALRRELVQALVQKKVLRKDIARALGLTESAICQYLGSKRGTRFRFSLLSRKKIQQSAERIHQRQSEEAVVRETCRLCILLSQQKVFCPICPGK